LTEQLSGTVGLRYTHDKKEFESQVLFYELGNGYFGGTGSEIFDPPLLVYDFSKATVGDLATKTEGMWSGKVQLDYRPADATLLYLSVSRGVKGPGFNTNVSGNLTNEQTPFDSENLIAYEIGAKTEFLDRKIRLNTSLYFYDYSRFQGFAFNGLQGVVGNYDGTFKGGEVEFIAAPGAGWMFGLSGSYMDTLLKDIPTVYNGIRDQQSIMAPEWTSNGYIRKDFDVGSGRLGLQWSFDYVGDRYASVENNYATLVPSSFVHNARVSYELPDNGLEFAAWVNNISDTDRVNFSFDLIASTGSLLQSYAKPRMYGLSIRKSF
jgi:iron complex outermembrane receptor protein